MLQVITDHIILEAVTIISNLSVWELLAWAIKLA